MFGTRTFVSVVTGTAFGIAAVAISFASVEAVHSHDTTAISAAAAPQDTNWATPNDTNWSTPADTNWSVTPADTNWSTPQDTNWGISA